MPSTRCGCLGSTPPIGIKQYSSSSMCFTCAGGSARAMCTAQARIQGSSHTVHSMTAQRQDTQRRQSTSPAPQKIPPHIPGPVERAHFFMKCSPWVYGGRALHEEVPSFQEGCVGYFSGGWAQWTACAAGAACVLWLPLHWMPSPLSGYFPGWLNLFIPGVLVTGYWGLGGWALGFQPVHPPAHLDAQPLHACLQAFLQVGERHSRTCHQGRLLKEHLGTAERNGTPAAGHIIAAASRGRKVLRVRSTHAQLAGSRQAPAPQPKPRRTLSPRSRTSLTHTHTHPITPSLTLLPTHKQTHWPTPSPCFW